MVTASFPLTFRKYRPFNRSSTTPCGVQRTVKDSRQEVNSSLVSEATFHEGPKQRTGLQRILGSTLLSLRLKTKNHVASNSMRGVAASFMSVASENLIGA